MAVQPSLTLLTLISGFIYATMSLYCIIYIVKIARHAFVNVLVGEVGKGGGDGVWSSISLPVELHTIRTLQNPAGISNTMSVCRST